MASAALEAVLQLLHRREGGGVSSIDQARARLEALATLIEPLPESRIDRVRVGGVACEWVVSSNAGDDGVLLYLHGGGYGLGSLATHRALASRLSSAARLPALTVGYRLAPEHPFPAAVDDAVAVYRALVGDEVPPERLVLAGDSAGGGLALATMIALRDQGHPLPDAAVCLSPWVDLDVSIDTLTAAAHRDPMVTPEELAVMAALYLGGADRRSPLASPLYAELHGLPPVLVHVGTAETLLGDSRRLAARMRSAGGDVVLEEWDDMIHVWHAFAPLLPEADEAIARIGAWIRDRLATSASRARRRREGPAAAAVGARSAAS
jgi:acetyl esterase/lipase